MLYIHTLKDLHPKTAEIEIVPLVREIKQNNSYPLKDEKVSAHLADFFVSAADIDSMALALDVVPETVKELKELTSSPNYEIENLERAIAALQEMPPALKKNLEYCREIFQWQEFFLTGITRVLNKIPTLKTREEQVEHNEKISALFEKILRNKEFNFNFWDVVNEAQLSRINNLVESMEQGFVFPVKLEEHLKQLNFNDLKNRIPEEELEKVQRITLNIKEIQKGVQRAYENNMRMINMSLVLYAYIRALKQ